MDVMPTPWMERLFARLTAIYGNRMATMWGDCPQADIIDAWREGLRGMDPESIAAALKACHREFPQWPPTLGEFVNLCRPVQVTSAHRLLPKLPDKPREPVAPEIKAKIDELLGRAGA